MSKPLFPPFLLAGLMAVAVVPAASAASISLGEVITNGGFGTDAAPSLAGWATAGTVIGRPSTNTINTSGGNAGFNGFFGSAFATLGDTSGAIGGTPNAGISSLSQTFVLPGTIGPATVDSYDLTINFRTAFDGRDDGSSLADADILSATLGTISLFSQTSTVFPSGAPSTNSSNLQLVNDPFNAVILGLQPGNYTLTVTLDESFGLGGGGFTNTAAGVDSVSVLATANMRVPEPSSLALLGAALIGLALSRRRA